MRTIFRCARPSLGEQDHLSGARAIGARRTCGARLAPGPRRTFRGAQPMEWAVQVATSLSPSSKET
jgi:hypothetical protein